ncbi:MAG: hypothetical protein QXF05_05255 [Thermofilaceae archaeon]
MRAGSGDLTFLAMVFLACLAATCLLLSFLEDVPFSAVWPLSALALLTSILAALGVTYSALMGLALRFSRWWRREG